MCANYLTDKTCDKLQSRGSSAQSLEWQPLPAAKLNSNVLIQCMANLEFLGGVVGQMIQ